MLLFLFFGFSKALDPNKKSNGFARSTTILIHVIESHDPFNEFPTFVVEAMPFICEPIRDIFKEFGVSAFRYVPAGSVYYFECKDKTNINQLTDKDRQIGFGQVILKEW